MLHAEKKTLMIMMSLPVLSCVYGDTHNAHSTHGDVLYLYGKASFHHDFKSLSFTATVG